MSKGGLKQPKPNQKGLKKLPKNVRNKMGFMKDGGMAMKKKGMAKGGMAMKKKGMAKGGAVGGVKKKAYAKGGKVMTFNVGGMVKSIVNNPKKKGMAKGGAVGGMKKKGMAKGGAKGGKK